MFWVEGFTWEERRPVEGAAIGRGFDCGGGGVPEEGRVDGPARPAPTSAAYAALAAYTT